MNKKYSDLLNQLKKALDDSKVQSNTELYILIKSYSDKLENGGEYRLICAKLTNAISAYVRSNHFKAPKSVLELYNYMANNASLYKGLAAVTTWI